MTISRPGDTFQPGDLLNTTYRIESVLGRGGTSEVYKARNEVSGRFVAIKALRSEFAGDEGFLTLMRREEEIREIRHDAVVRYSENHRTPDGRIYLVMDYVEGPGLDAILKDGGMGAQDLLAVCRRVAEGLQAAHARRIVHRDLSPDNIILRGGRPDAAVIIDFGIAKDSNAGAQTIVGNEFAGKYAYAAPEQLSGQTDARTDIYSLGALLLATFRGARPDIGRNPMEVLQRKAEPLDTEGVPEPLKALIDRMTHPDPAQRFQSAAALLAALGPLAGEEDGTVIVPRAQADPAGTQGEAAGAQGAASRRSAPAGPAPSATPAATPAAAPAPPRGDAPAQARRRGGTMVLGAALALALLGAGGYFGGYLDAAFAPALPTAEPYLLTVARPAGGAPRAEGFAPTQEAADAIAAALGALGGTAEIALARGAIGETWGEDVLGVLDILAPVESWDLAVSGNTARITGTTDDAALRERVLAAFSAGFPGVLEGEATLRQGPLILTAEAVERVLRGAADCGPLALVDPPQIGYAMGATVAIRGRLADPATRAALHDALAAIAGDRTLAIDAEILNPALCLIETSLPRVPEGPLRIGFGFGDRDGDNPSGRYFVGENPVIDVTVPAEVTDGFLSVSILDVSGNVFHLLPNVNRTAHDIATLRDGREGAFEVRVAYPLAEASAERLAFLVDATTLGKSRVITLLSDAPLFDEMRPTTESAAGYAEALSAGVGAGIDGGVRSINARILTTAEP